MVPGPNTRSPLFQQPVYDVVVSEGVPLNTTVTSVYVSRSALQVLLLIREFTLR